jgi:predicted RNA-binding protein with PIN domain
MPYLFDGYNLYHAMCKYSEVWSHTTPATMCSLIAEDMQRLRDHAVIVFDGTHRGKPHQGLKLPRVKILFSGPKSDADSAIEKLIQKNTAPRRLQVISSDNRIRRAARRRRAKIHKTAEYLDALVKRMHQPPPPLREPKEKRHGLEPDQLDEWLDLFGLNPDNIENSDIDRTRF